MHIIVWSYRRIAKVLKWLCITLLSYILIPFLIEVDWLAVLKNTVLPTFTADSAFFMALVGILGTTISPYLFFWQASMEVEERSHRRHVVVDKQVICDMEFDVRGGMLFTNVVFYFIILASGTVLYEAGCGYQRWNRRLVRFGLWRATWPTPCSRSASSGRDSWPFPCWEGP